MSVLNKSKPLSHLALGASALLCSTMFTAPAAAQDTSDQWQFRASAYGYFPDVSTSAALPTGSSSIDVEAGDLIEHARGGFMGVFEVQRGRFGAFADLLYVNIGDSVNDSTQISVGGGMPLPPGVTVDGDLDIKLTAFTIAGVYRAYNTPATTFDVFAGARLLNIDTDFSYAFNVPFGPFQGPMQSGAASASLQNWDFIAGVKGRYNFGAERQWFVQYYADVGTGDADLTWQAFGGVGRSFGRYDVFAGWRYLSYDFSSDSRIEDLSFNGPVVGASVSW